MTCDEIKEIIKTEIIDNLTVKLTSPNYMSETIEIALEYKGEYVSSIDIWKSDITSILE